MAEKKEKKGKKGIGAIIAIILIPIILIVFIASAFFAIINGIVQTIVEIIGEIVEGLLKLLSDPVGFFENAWKWVENKIAEISNWFKEEWDAEGSFNPNAYENNRTDPVTIIDLKTFEEMKKNLDTIISRNTAGLDDATLKKMLLAYYRGLFLDDTQILIELSHIDFGLSEDKFKVFLKGQELLQEIAELRKELESTSGIGNINKIANKIVSKENELNALDLTEEEIISNESKINPFTIIEGNEDNGIGENGKLYLQTKGMIQVYSDVDFNEDGEKDKLLYYHPNVLYNIYNEHYIKMLKKGTTNATAYANSIKEYLGKCYTYTENGLKMYTMRTIENTEKTWEYRNETSNVEADRTRKLTPTKIYPVKEQIIEYSNKVSEYTTPVEFMIYLLEITGSKEFVNAFIETAGNENYIKLQLYRLTNGEGEESEEQMDRTTTITGDRAKKYTAEVVSSLDASGVFNGTFKSWKNVGVDEFQEDVGTVEVIATTDDPNDTKLSVKITGNFKKNYKYKIKLYYDGEKVDDITTDEFVKNGTEITVYFYNLMLDEDSKTDTSLVIEHTQKETSTEQYGIAISEVKTWYSKFKAKNIVNASTVIDILQKNPNNNKIERENIIKIQNAESLNVSEQFEKVIGENNVWVELNDVRSKEKDRFYNPDIFKVKTLTEISESYKENANKEQEFEGYTEDECLNVQFNYVREKGQGNAETSSYQFNTMSYTDRNIRKWGVYLTYNEALSEGVSEGRISGDQNDTKNYDQFLGLLSNKYGYYKLGASYKPVSNVASSGKLVEYNDIYGGKTKVGELLVNGSDMLFQFLASTERTEGLVQVMKYILAQYSGNDYGVTEWSFEIFPKANMQEIPLDVAA